MTIEELQKEIDRKGKLKHVQEILDDFFRRFHDTIGVEPAALTPFDHADLTGLRSLLFNAAARILKGAPDGQKVTAACNPNLPHASVG